jgi:hypothetical protein
MDTSQLFRPVGEAELALIRDSGWKAFPPRLPEQPIFYPVLDEDYAIQLLCDGRSGFEIWLIVLVQMPLWALQLTNLSLGKWLINHNGLAALAGLALHAKDRSVHIGSIDFSGGYWRIPVESPAIRQLQSNQDLFGIETLSDWDYVSGVWGQV